MNAPIAVPPRFDRFNPRTDCGRIRSLLLAAMAIAGCFTHAGAANVLKGVEASQPPGSQPVLHVDFLLPEAETISTVEASAGGKAIGNDKVKFTAAAPDQRCAILFLIDNTPDMGDYFPHIKLCLQKFATLAETAPCQIGAGTFSDDVQMLVPIGGKIADLKSPDILKKIDGSGPSTEIYLCAQHAIPILEQTKAARKFLVIISNGRGEDKKYTHDETVKAALASKVRICTIGYAQPQGDHPSYLQTLTKLSEETGGYKGRASVSTRELPANFEANLIKYTGSGGSADVTLAGLTAPLTVDFKVTTESKREYVFSQKLDAFAVETPPEKPAEPEKPADVPKPDKEPDKQPEKIVSSQPAAPLTFIEKIKQKFKERPDLFAIGGGAALIVLLLLVVALRRLRGGEAQTAASPLDAEPPVAPQFVMPEPDTEVKPVEEGPVLAWLESLDAAQTRHAIRKGAMRIGRKEDNDIALKNDSVSNYHAELVKRGEQFLITDLGASNGVYLNHKRVEKGAVEHNDLIELGEVRFRFLLPDVPTPNP